MAEHNQGLTAYYINASPVIRAYRYWGKMFKVSTGGWLSIVHFSFLSKTNHQVQLKPWKKLWPLKLPDSILWFQQQLFVSNSFVRLKSQSDFENNLQNSISELPVTFWLVNLQFNLLWNTTRIVDNEFVGIFSNHKSINRHLKSKGKNTTRCISFVIVSIYHEPEYLWLLFFVDWLTKAWSMEVLGWVHLEDASQNLKYVQISSSKQKTTSLGSI